MYVCIEKSVQQEAESPIVNNAQQRIQQPRTSKPPSDSHDLDVQQAEKAKYSADLSQASVEESKAADNKQNDMSTTTTGKLGTSAPVQDLSASQLKTKNAQLPAAASIGAQMAQTNTDLNVPKEKLQLELKQAQNQSDDQKFEQEKFDLGRPSRAEQGFQTLTQGLTGNFGLGGTAKLPDVSELDDPRLNTLTQYESQPDQQLVPDNKNHQGLTLPQDDFQLMTQNEDGLYDGSYFNFDAQYPPATTNVQDGYSWQNQNNWKRDQNFGDTTNNQAINPNPKFIVDGSPRQDSSEVKKSQLTEAQKQCKESLKADKKAKAPVHTSVTIISRGLFNSKKVFFIKVHQTITGVFCKRWIARRFI